MSNIFLEKNNNYIFTIVTDISDTLQAWPTEPCIWNAYSKNYTYYHFDGFVQTRSNSIALAIELRLSHTNSAV